MSLFIKKQNYLKQYYINEKSGRINFNRKRNS